MSEYIVTLTVSEGTKRWLSRLLVTAMAPKDAPLDGDGRRRRLAGDRTAPESTG